VVGRSRQSPLHRVRGLLNGAVFLSIYPHIHNNDLILFMGSLESIGAALSARQSRR